MKKVSIDHVPEDHWSSPKRTFEAYGKNISEALGRQPRSTDLFKRHPFDLEVLRIPPGKKAWPYHAHSAQWEFYVVASGSGVARDDEGAHAITAGDAFMYYPGEAHQLANDSGSDLIVYIIADNPFGDTCYYPDSGKWTTAIPERQPVRATPANYYDGEE